MLYSKPTSVNYIVKKLGGQKIHIPKRPGEPERSQADIRKIKNFLNGNHKLTLIKVLRLC